MSFLINSSCRSQKLKKNKKNPVFPPHQEHSSNITGCAQQTEPGGRGGPWQMEQGGSHTLTHSWKSLCFCSSCAGMETCCESALNSRRLFKAVQAHVFHLTTSSAPAGVVNQAIRPVIKMSLKETPSLLWLVNLRWPPTPSVPNRNSCCLLVVALPPSCCPSSVHLYFKYGRCSCLSECEGGEGGA